MEQTKLNRFKRIKHFSVIASLLVLFTIICSVFYQDCQASTYQKVEKIETNTDKESEQHIVDSVRTKETIKEELIEEVSAYIKTKTNAHHQFIPKYIVHAGLTHNIDICFMMAQTQIETCFGTKGAGRESSRRSLFGVAIHKYSDYEQAIDAYCKLLHKSYLGQGKTEQHLMIKYVTLRGGRYASNPNYEKDLKAAYNQIKRKTHIYSLQQKYKNMNF